MGSREPSKPDMLFNGPRDAHWKIALAHGAGAGMDTPFMNAFAEGLAASGLRVARFEFPYMAERRHTGQKRPPDREPVLRATWLQVVAALGRERLAIGGKSMGGRFASLVADEAGVAGLVCLAAQRERALGIGLLSGGYGRDELEWAWVFRVYQDPADLPEHLDEIGVQAETWGKKSQGFRQGFV